MANAQEQKLIDSLLNILPAIKVDTVKAKILNDISWEYNQGNPSIGLKYAKELLDFSQKLNYHWGINAAYTNMSFSYEYQHNYGEALKYRLLSLKETDRYGNKKQLAKSYNNLANIYMLLKDYPSALKYYHKKIELISALNDPKLAKNLASTYNNMLLLYKNLGQSDSALRYMALADKCAAADNTELLANIRINSGLLFADMNDLRKANSEFKTALIISNKVNLTRLYPLIYFHISGLFQKAGSSDSALHYMQLSLKYGRISEQRDAVLDAYQGLAMLYQQGKDYEHKSEYMEKYNLLRDSLFTEALNSQMNDLKVRFDTEEKEKENQLLQKTTELQALQLKQKNFLLLGLSLLSMLIIGFIWLILKQNKLKAEQRSMQLEQKLLRLQMNPHFIFNSLAAIESFIYENKPETAGSYLSGFARLMRLTLENTREEYIILKKEIEGLKHYLHLQQLNADDAFTYTIDTADAVDPGNILVPPMLFQPFVENAIKYGVHEIENGHIAVSFTIENNTLIVLISDNGTGFRITNSKDHVSLATQITRERVALLHRRKRKISFEVLPSGNGTRVRFVIPLN
jgi:tetratricopeptide (TPR) repeat protein